MIRSGCSMQCECTPIYLKGKKAHFQDFQAYSVLSFLSYFLFNGDKELIWSSAINLHEKMLVFSV